MSTKLVMCIIQDEDEKRLRDAMVEGGYGFTKIGSTGGFLRQGNVTLIAVTEEAKLQGLVDIVTEACHERTQLVNPYLYVGHEGLVGEPFEVRVGGAVLFVLNVDSTVRV